VVVVDRRPLERNLVRFILQENGFDVTAEAATPADAVRAVERDRPAVVVLHENAAWERGRPTIPQLRQALPGAKVLVITPAFGVVRVELLRDADAVLEEGIGFKDLPFVIGRLAAGDAARGVPQPRGETGAVAPRRSRERWINRFQGATAAAVVFLAFMIAGAAGPPGPERLGATPAVALRQARDSLEDLQAASKGPSDELIRRAIALASNRAVAVEAGANVSTLDADIVALVDDVLPSLAPGAADTLLLVLADVPGLPTPTPTPAPTEEEPSPEPSTSAEASPTPSEAVTPTQSPSPAEEPTEQPSAHGSPPAPSEEPSPKPTEQPSPSPKPTEEPSPSPSEEPSPTPTVEPSPRQQPSPTQEPSPTDSPSSPSPSWTESPSPIESPSPTASPPSTDTTSPTPTSSSAAPTSSSAAPTTSATSPSTPSPSSTETPTPADAGPGDGMAILVLSPGIGVVASAIARRRARRSRR
jgi:hypothetical protein